MRNRNQAVSESEYLPEQSLAAFVVALAIHDMSSKDRGVRADARRFLFSQDHKTKAIRHFWFAWIDWTDESFGRLIRRNSFQGLPNKLAGVMQMVDMAAGSYFTSLPALEHDDKDDDLFVDQSALSMAA